AAGVEEAAIGMADQHGVAQALPFEDVDDIGDVGGEVHLAVDEMRALAEPGHGRGEHLVALLLQEVRDPPPAPAAVPGAVHEHEGLAARLRLRVRPLDHADHPYAGRHAGDLPLSPPHETCNSTSTSHSGASTITSCPELVASNVRQDLSALHSAKA